MGRFEEDMNRGCLSTGEPLEALYGGGPWSDDILEHREPPVVQCYRCDGPAYDLGGVLHCKNCGEIPAPKAEMTRHCNNCGYEWPDDDGQCPQCGSDDTYGLIGLVCPECNGDGWTAEHICDGDERACTALCPVQVQCSVCGGSGYLEKG